MHNAITYSFNGDYEAVMYRREVAGYDPVAHCQHACDNHPII